MYLLKRNLDYHILNYIQQFDFHCNIIMHTDRKNLYTMGHKSFQYN